MLSTRICDKERTFRIGTIIFPLFLSQELKKEKELYCSVHKQKKTSLDEMRKYTQLKALLAYGRKHRLDAILARREHEKRMASTSKASKTKKTYTCAFQDDGVRCFSTCIPLTKFCIRHILMVSVP